MKKLCLIGCGGIGKQHLTNLLMLDDLVEVVGFCDYDEERALDCVRLAKCGRAYTDHKVMLDTEQPDIVYICVPPYCHGEIERDVIERGIHFFTEKPVALDLDTAVKIRDAAEAKGLITAVGFQCRYSLISEQTRAFCTNHEIICVDCTRVGHVPSAFWWRDKELSGGQLVEQSIHQLDIIRYAMGEPDEVFTYNTRGFVKGVTDYNTDDCSVTVVKFKNGAVGTITSGCYSTGTASFDSKIVFSSRDCRAELKILDKLTIVGDKNEMRKEKEAELRESGKLATIGERTHEFKDTETNESLICDRTFIEAVISGDGSNIRSSYRDGVNSLAFALACNKSMETGAPVKVETK